MNKDRFLELSENWESHYLVRVYKEKKEMAKFICEKVDMTDRWIHMSNVHLILGANITDATLAYSSTFSAEETVNIEKLSLEKLKVRL